MYEKQKNIHLNQMKYDHHLNQLYHKHYHHYNLMKVRSIKNNDKHIWFRFIFKRVDVDCLLILLNKKHQKLQHMKNNNNHKRHPLHHEKRVVLSNNYFHLHHHHLNEVFHHLIIVQQILINDQNFSNLIVDLFLSPSLYIITVRYVQF